MGGSKKSEHLYDIKGKGAVDVKVIGEEDEVVEKWIDANWKESVGYGMKYKLGFTHVGCRGDGSKNRWNYGEKEAKK